MPPLRFEDSILDCVPAFAIPMGFGAFRPEPDATQEDARAMVRNGCPCPDSEDVQLAEYVIAYLATYAGVEGAALICRSTELYSTTVWLPIGEYHPRNQFPAIHNAQSDKVPPGRPLNGSAIGNELAHFLRVANPQLSTSVHRRSSIEAFCLRRLLCRSPKPC